MCGQRRSLALRTHRTKRFLCATCAISSGVERPGQCNVTSGVELLKCIVLELIRNKMHAPSLEPGAVLVGSLVPCIAQQLVHHTFMAMAKDLKATPRKMRAFGWNDEWNLLPFEVAPVF